MKKRFLVTSILMLLLTVFALSTSTYAWFSMNNNVSVTGMQVIAKTDDTYLIISGTNTTAAAIQAENSNKGNTEVAKTMDASASKVKPSTPCLDASQTALLTLGTEQNGHKDIDGNLITTAAALANTSATAPVATNWYTAKAVDGTVSTMKEGTARQLTQAKFGEYVIKQTVYLTIAKGANDAWNLRAKATFTQNTNTVGEDTYGNDVDACKVVVVTNTGGWAILTNSDTDYSQINGGSSDVITDTTVITVDMYIFYDGTDDAVFTNNTANLLGAKFNIAFEVDAKPAA